ncbi:sigma-70 family RNA polymerase sigma factor [Caldibacillus lycopersici]|uniref:Sigma-70 family RNA polymerase sigma factor n=1 Tax=Perspicuibacillus lycopersici TaxID=1325689 RepID=A0AAE3IV56_9BACI|nr:sigma-70 family RNA polymerase sigma factor [Perspicuibacillus lycopersici]MCU9615037.1 sigma-70 family RNA polymerase sigma factor [Perspicuibacillus lycopersici]
MDMVEQLLKEAQKGDQEAFFQLLTVHKEQLYRVAYAYLKNEADSLEAIQEVTYRAYKNIKKVKEPKYFSTWLTRIMMNYCNDEWKRRKRLSGKEPTELLLAHVKENDARLSIEAAIQTLDPKLQEVIVLKYFQDMTIEQIAYVLKRPSGTVKTWLNKALRMLRKQLEEGGEFHG